MDILPHSVILFFTALVSLGVAWVAFQRKGVPGSHTLALLMIAAAEVDLCGRDRICRNFHAR